MSLPPDDETPPGGEQPPARRRTPRPLPDLSALYGDSQPAPAEQPNPPAEEPAAAESSESRRRTPRSLPDLSALYGDSKPAPAEQPKQPAEEPAAAEPSESRRRTPRSLPDISALYGDSQPAPAEQPKPPAEQPAAATPSESRRRTPRPMADLSFLYKKEAPSRPTETKTAPPTDQPAPAEATVFPPELQRYLPPDLWRKLTNENPPRRGVLINALERLRSILYLLSTYLPQHLVQAKMRKPSRGLVSGEVLKGSLLFADVSGFTALSERLAYVPPEAAEREIELRNQGAEQLTTIMNQYFDIMWGILSWSGGILIKFAGDAALVYFPFQESGNHALSAVNAGLRMLRAMSQFANLPTPSEPVTLKMKIGVASGDFLSASIGSSSRIEYAILGPAITRTMGAEGATTGPGQLVADEETVKLLGSQVIASPQAPGYFSLQLPPEKVLDQFEIKAKARRARGAIPWDANPQMIQGQMRVALAQIQALEPYLAQELTERIIIRASERGILSEFRLTTVLFCNFTGFEALYDHWGAAGTHRLTSMLSAYFAGMSNIISRYGGIVSRIDPYSKGVKLLALFGAPVSHEDDPQRAVSAALAMNGELDALNEQWRQRFGRHLPPDLDGPAIQHRIGITQGETFAGLVGSHTRREYTVMGDDVNLSARLMSAARPGQILISLRVHQAVNAFFITTQLPAIRVKGKSKPIPLHQVDGPREDTLSHRIQSRGPLIGRGDELAKAKAAFHRCLQGHSQALTLLGPAGIGKSHLADAIIQFAQAQGAHTLLHQCRAYRQNTSYAAWSAPLRSLMHITVTDLPRTQSEKLRQTLQQWDISLKEVPPLETILGIHLARQERSRQVAPAEKLESTEDILSAIAHGGRTGRKGGRLDVLGQVVDQSILEGQTWLQVTHLRSDQRQALLNAVYLVLDHLLDEAPLVVFFEDAQWLDLASYQLLLEQQERLRDRPFFILLAQREETSERSAIGQVIKLKPFQVDETNALITHILVDDLIELIHQQGKGIPLYIDEISRWIKRTRQIGAEDLRGVLQTSDILQKLVLSGLEELNESQREVARVASVIGEDFRFGQVQELLSATITMDSITLNSHLHALAEARLIVPREAGVDARYAFQQSLVREVLYNSLPFSRRRALHKQIATYLSAPRDRRSEVQSRLASLLSSSTGSDPAQVAEVIAYHFEQAEEWLEATQNLLKAASLARGQQAYARAEALLQRALQALARLPAQAEDASLNALTYQVNLALGDACMLQNQFAAAIPAYEAARQEGPPADDSAAACRLAGKYALALATQNQAAPAQTALQAALEEASGDLGLALLACAAWVHWRSASPEAGSHIQRCQAALHQQQKEWATDLEILMNDLAGEWAAVKAAYQMHNFPESAALAAIRLGDQFLQKDDLRGALGQYEHAAKLWHTTPQEECGLALVRYRQAEAAWKKREAEAALTALQEAQARLANCSSPVQVEGRDLVRQAIKIVKTQKAAAWPAWRWQAVDDALRIAILLKPLL